MKTLVYRFLDSPTTMHLTVPGPTEGVSVCGEPAILVTYERRRVNCDRCLRPSHEPTRRTE